MTKITGIRCLGCNQGVEGTWAYCPFCGAQGRIADLEVVSPRERFARLAISKSQLHGECDNRGAQDPETGEVPCSRRDGCLCDELANHGDAIAKAIREA